MLFVVLPFLVVLVVVSWLFCVLGSRRERAAQIAEHRSLSRRIYGCLECGVEIIPPGRLLRCGQCREETTLCLACGLGSSFAKKHAHSDWHRDLVVLEKRWVVPEPLSLPNVMRSSFLFWRDRQLLQSVEWGDEWMSYEAVGKKVDAVAAHLVLDLGIKPGDRVFLCSPSVPAFYILEWACFSAGLVAVPVNADTPAEHLAVILRLSEPKLVFCTTGRLGAADGAFVLWTREEDVMSVGNTLSRRLPLPETQPDSVAMLLPTSGTTGVPKLVVFTDQMLSRAASIIPKQANEMVLLAYQTLRQAIDVLSKGGRISCLSWKAGNLEQLIAAARQVRPTVMGGMPSLFSALQLYRSNVPTSVLLGNRLRMVVIGGARSTEALKKWIFSALSAVCLDGYGSTEVFF